MALTNKLTAIADAIRAKTGGSSALSLDDMVTEIGNISGGSSPVIESKTITTNGTYTAPSGVDGYSPVVVNVAGGIDINTTPLTYLFYKGRFLDKVSSSEEIILTFNNNTIDHSFYQVNNPGKNIPGFVLHDEDHYLDYSNSYISNVFTGKNWLNIPKFDITTYDNVNRGTNMGGVSMKFPVRLWGMTHSSGIWDELPNHVADFVRTFCKRVWGSPDKGYQRISTYNDPECALFSAPIKSIDNFLNNFKPRLWRENSSYSYWSFYGNLLVSFGIFNSQYLKDMTNVCVVDNNGSEITSNMFLCDSSATAYTLIGYFGTKGSTWKDFTFELLNGQPYPVKWKNQVIKLGSSGWSSVSTSGVGGTGVISYTNKSIPLPIVTNTATYEQYKNQHYQTDIPGYSRYNHDSAVNTLNSLPDTTYGGEYSPSGNTITFWNSQYHGALTDGGPVSDLTAAEIAVATEKGWTVTLN